MAAQAVLGLAAAGVLLAACSGDKPDPSHPNALVDLVAALPSASIERDIPGLPFQDASEHRYLTAGWHPFELSGIELPFAWTGERNAVVEVPVVEPGPLRIRMRVDPGRRIPQFPGQQVALLWNGELMLRAKLAWQHQILQITVPPSLQRSGINLLEIRPHYWFGASQVYRAKDRRTLGVRVLGIEFIRGRVELASEDDAPLARIDGESVVQRAGSAVQYFTDLPVRARLRGRVRMHTGDPQELLDAAARFAADGYQIDSRWAVRLTAGDGRQHDLATGELADLAAGGPVELDLDLSAWEEENVGLALAVTTSMEPQRGGPKAPESLPMQTVPLEVAWDALRVEGWRVPDPPEPTSIPRARYNVLVVLFDTLRSDHLAAYGNAEVRSPRISDLARSGVLFTNAFANASWTRPAVASLLTATYPSAHRTEVMKTDKLPESLPFLPQLLKDQGYKTVSVVNNANVDDSFGFGRGFDQVHPIYQEERRWRRIEDPEERAAAVWNDYVAPHIEGEDPFFVYLHEIDPHAPYWAPEPFRSEYVDDDYPGFIGSNGYNKLVNSGMMKLSEADLAHFNALYRAEITFMDSYLGWVMAELERTGRREDTLVVFVSDHGEEFGEHGGIKHGRSLYEHQVRVPLILSLPGVLPSDMRATATAEQVDVVPTILDLIGAEIPRDVQGRTLLPIIAAGGREQPRVSFSKVGREGVDGTAWNAVRLGRHKLVRKRFKNGTQRFELFDLEDDPSERNDLWPGRFTLAQSLRQHLVAHENRSAAIAADAESLQPGELDRRVQKNLRALGYLE